MDDIILNIETSTEVCSVSLQKGEECLGERNAAEPMSHTRVLTKLIEELFELTGVSINALKAVAVSAGPGSYTGLRVGAATAKGLCYAADIPLIGVSTLKALADKMRTEEELCPGDILIPMLDARRMEVYTAIYNSEGYEMVPIHALILTPEAFSEYRDEGNRLVIAGPGAAKYFEHFPAPSSLYPEIGISASNMIPQVWKKYCNAAFEDLAYFEPQYLKAPNITISKRALL